MKVFHESACGMSHASRGEACQDASAAFEIPGVGAVVAVADGLGSCPRSGVASRIAIDVVERELGSMPLPGSGEDALGVAEAFIKVAFAKALDAISRRADADGLPWSDYLTTLSVAFFNGRGVSWGHSGDGALIGVTSFGTALKLTEEQNAGSRSVVHPLQSGPSKWVFGRDGQEEYCTVFATTDGLLEAIQPQLLGGGLYERLCGAIAGVGETSREECPARSVVRLEAHTGCELFDLMAERAASDAATAARCLQDDLSLAVAVNEELAALAELKPEPDWHGLALQRDGALSQAAESWLRAARAEQGRTPAGSGHDPERLNESKAPERSDNHGS